MPPSLRQLAKVADRLQADVAQLQSCITALAAAEGRPQQTAVPKQRERWTGPVPAEERGKRQEAWGGRYLLAMELGLNPSETYFAMVHRLGHPCVVARWLTSRSRCIRPGSPTDERIWQAVREDIPKFEAMKAKRHGNLGIANPAPRIPVTMTA